MLTNGINTTNGFHTPATAGPPSPLRLFVLSHPRTASNLFCKLFSEHPQLKNSESTLLFAYFNGPDAQASLEDAAEEEAKVAREAVKSKFKHASYQFVLDKLEQDVLEAESERKLPFFKEHSCYVIRATVVNDVIESYRGLPVKPKMEDKLLDVSEHERHQYLHIAYHELSSRAYNPTVFPDRLWKTFAPIFIIRHPVKQVGSYYKASRVRQLSVDSPEFEISTSYKFSRILFDYFRTLYQGKGEEISSEEKELQWPIVIDGDDLISDTEGTVRRFCAIAHLDPSGVIYKWEKTITENPFESVFKGTLNASSGIVKNESPDEMPDIAKEAKKWEKEWGGNIAHRLVQYTEQEMANYEYLYQFRL